LATGDFGRLRAVEWYAVGVSGANFHQHHSFVCFCCVVFACTLGRFSSFTTVTDYSQSRSEWIDVDIEMESKLNVAYAEVGSSSAAAALPRSVLS
jgi:hypothetical protein